jgi:putative transposase
MPYWRLFYHMVWATRGREPLIQPAMEAAVHKAICSKASALGAMVYAVGGIEEHVHLVLSAPPRLALADLIGQIKGSSSHLVNHTLAPEASFAWQAEYGVLSFSGKQLDNYVKYVRNQREHHSEGKIIPALERVSEDEKSGAEQPS